MIAQSLQTGHPKLEKLVMEGQQEIEEERLVEIVRQYQ